MLELIRERIGKNNIISAGTVEQLTLIFKFSKNKANIKIYESNGNYFQIPSNFNKINKIESLYEVNDFEMEKDVQITDISQSNIGLFIINHPFSFYLYN